MFYTDAEMTKGIVGAIPFAKKNLCLNGTKQEHNYAPDALHYNIKKNLKAI